MIAMMVETKRSDDLRLDIYFSLVKWLPGIEPQGSASVAKTQPGVLRWTQLSCDLTEPYRSTTQIVKLLNLRQV